MHKTKRPLVLWTTQRTGSTRLTHVLGTVVDTKMLHEPFNPGRPFSPIRQTFLEDNDWDRLAATIEGKLGEGISLKICVDVVGLGVITATSHAAARLGFANVLLTRASVPRMLSREFAKRSNVWGPDQIDRLGDTDTIFRVPLNIARILEKEAVAIMRLNYLCKLMDWSGRDNVRLRYEDLFETQGDASRTAMGALLSSLGVPHDAATRDSIAADLQSEGTQGTRDLYTRFKGVNRLEELAETLPRSLF